MERKNGDDVDQLLALAARILSAEHALIQAESATQSFVRLGGDSLLAMRLAALAHDQFGVDISLADIMGATPLSAALALTRPLARPENDNGADPAGPAAADEVRAVDEPPGAPSDGRLTPAQRGMWLAQQVIGGSPYNLVFICFIEGELNADLIERAVHQTVARHDGLRTVFRDEDGVMTSRSLPGYRPPITEFHHEGDAAHEGEDFRSFVRRTAERTGRRPFLLDTEPALRFGLAAHGTERHALIVCAHHLLLDGWAAGLVLTEIFERYATLAAGAEPDFGAAPRLDALVRHLEKLRGSPGWAAHMDYWEQRLDGMPTVLDLPAERSRPVLQDPAGARIGFELGRETTQQVMARARDLGVTPFAFLLAGFALTLSRHTGTRRLLIGVPVARRTVPALEKLVAVVGNLVPVRIEVDDDQTCGHYVNAVHASLTRSLDHGDLPFEDLVARFDQRRTTDRHPLVQVSFGMHDQLLPRTIAVPNLGVVVEEAHGGGSQFDLTLLIRDSDPMLAGTLEYATSVWTAAAAEAFGADFAASIEELVHSPGRVLEHVRCMPAWRRDMIDRLNATSRPYPLSSIAGRFLAQVRGTPDAIAVRDDDYELSFRDLAAAAAAQAGLLADAGVRRGDTVFVGVDRSVSEIVALLGVLWAGAAYAGVDPRLPPGRLDQIRALAKPAAVIADEGFGDLPVVTPWTAWRTAAPPDDDPSMPSMPPLPTFDDDPDRPAYIAFTSGSSGVPKGVCVPHRAVVRLVHEAGHLGLGPDERVLRLSPLAFDASTFEIWGPLLSGGTVEIHPAGLPTPAELGRFLVERKVTVAWLTSGLFRLVAEFAPDSLSGLRQLITGGDVVPAEHVVRMLERHPGLVVTNGYGPTENTTFSTTHSVTRPDDVDDNLPIGRPIPNSQAYVLDDRHRLVPPGAVGELFVGGDGLALGYIGNEEETARRFGRFSPDVPSRLYRTGDITRLDGAGRLRFLGRRDDQVKIRGYRIELTEIRTILRTHPDVHDCLVVVSGGGSEDKRLLAACVPRPAAALDAGHLAGELAEFLTDRLPSYMVPALWAIVDSIPVTGNGKVDRRALEARAAPVTAGRRAPAPDALHEQVASLAAEVLAPHTLGDERDFFAVGGDSLRAVRLISLLGERLGVEVRLRDFLLHPTLSGLVRLVRKAREADGAGA